VPAVKEAKAGLAAPVEPAAQVELAERVAPVESLPTPGQVARAAPVA
jgi:hypothetical protein